MRAKRCAAHAARRVTAAGNVPMLPRRRHRQRRAFAAVVRVCDAA